MPHARDSLPQGMATALYQRSRRELFTGPEGVRAGALLVCLPGFLLSFPATNARCALSTMTRIRTGVTTLLLSCCSRCSLRTRQSAIAAFDQGYSLQALNFELRRHEIETGERLQGCTIISRHASMRVRVLACVGLSVNLLRRWVAWQRTQDKARAPLLAGVTVAR